MEFIKWYRNIVEKAGKEPPPDAWERIQDELDIEAVWQNLEKELPVPGNRKIYFHLAAAASLLLLIGTGILLMQVRQYHRPDPFQAGYDFSPATPAGGVSFPVAVRMDFPTLRANVTGLEAEDDFDGAMWPRQFEHTEDNFDGELTLVSPAGADIYIKSISRDMSGIPGRKLPPVQKTSSGTLSGSQASSGWHTGISGNLANTWLLNNKTIQGLRSDDLTASLPSFGYSLGILAGKTLNRNFELQGEIQLISVMRQDYNEYLHGKYVDNQMYFNYTGFSLSIRWFLGRDNYSGRHSIFAGTYTGILRNALQDLDGESISLRNEYRNTDHGLIAGYEYLMPLGRDLFLGTGLRTKIGLNNIFAGNDIIPDYLNNTRNASLNLVISLRYDLK